MTSTILLQFAPLDPKRFQRSPSITSLTTNFYHPQLALWSIFFTSFKICPAWNLFRIRIFILQHERIFLRMAFLLTMGRFWIHEFFYSAARLAPIVLTNPTWHSQNNATDNSIDDRPSSNWFQSYLIPASTEAKHYDPLGHTHGILRRSQLPCTKERMGIWFSTHLIHRLIGINFQFPHFEVEF